MSKQSLYLGKRGEEAAINFLKENGYKILTRNYKTKLGEVDVIAFDKKTLCFIEVKARSSCRFGFPQEAVSGFKQKQIAKAALLFLKENKLLNALVRFDVLSVIYGQDSIKLNLIKNAFELDQRFSL